jgi:hypothetical protein
MSERTVVDEDTYDQILDIFQGAATVEATKSTHGGRSIELQDSKETDQLVEVEFVRGVGKRLVEETGYFISGIRQHTGDDPRIEVWFDEINIHMSSDSNTSEDRESEEEVPEYEGQIIFKGDFHETIEINN